MKLTKRIDLVVNQVRRNGMIMRPLDQPEWVLDVAK
jgi:hypothetical protein